MMKKEQTNLSLLSTVPLMLWGTVTQTNSETNSSDAFISEEIFEIFDLKYFSTNEHSKWIFFFH